MRSSFLGLFFLTLFLNQGLFGSDENWHKVLTCDDGAAVIDNRFPAAIDRGGHRMIEVQIVVRDMNIIRYFNQKGAAKTGLFDSELIARGYQYVAYETNELLSSGVRVKGTVNDLLQALGQINFDGHGVYLSLGNNGNQANWYFRNCERE